VIRGKLRVASTEDKIREARLTAYMVWAHKEEYGHTNEEM